jgi:transposase
MTRRVREWNVDQSMLLPLSVHNFVPADHVAHFIRDTVAEELELSAVWAAYGGDRGQPPYHPAMMTALLLYAYCQGIYASRRIAAACEQRVDFMAVTGMERRTSARSAISANSISVLGATPGQPVETPHLVFRLPRRPH